MNVKILLADDSLTVRTSMEIIARNRYELLAVADGKDALQKTGSFQPSIIFIDAILPDCKTEDVIKNLKIKFQDVPIIILHNPQYVKVDENSLKNAGADSFLIKPFESKTIFETINNLCLSMENNEIERVERIKAERIKAERVETERVETERVEAERVETERVETERIEAERIEAERIEAERVETERIEAERIEAERIETERIRNMFEKEEKLRKEQDEKVETERIASEQDEVERVEAERVETERIETERIEAERVETERIETERIETERIETERIETERIEAENGTPIVENVLVETIRVDNTEEKLPEIKEPIDFNKKASIAPSKQDDDWSGINEVVADEDVQDYAPIKRRDTVNLFKDFGVKQNAQMPIFGGGQNNSANSAIPQIGIPHIAMPQPLVMPMQASTPVSLSEAIDYARLQNIICIAMGQALQTIHIPPPQEAVIDYDKLKNILEPIDYEKLKETLSDIDIDYEKIKSIILESNIKTADIDYGIIKTIILESSNSTEIDYEKIKSIFQDFVSNNKETKENNSSNIDYIELRKIVSEEMSNILSSNLTKVFESVAWEILPDIMKKMLKEKI